jgi:hypothetical protein
MPAKLTWEHKGYSRVAKNRGYSDTLCKENERTCSNLWGVNRRAHRERVALDWQLSLGNMGGLKEATENFQRPCPRTGRPFMVNVSTRAAPRDFGPTPPYVIGLEGSRCCY